MAWHKLAGLLLAAILVSPSEAADFRLLRLDGHTVKWGAPALGAGAALTWSFARRRHEFPDAFNCRVLKPLDALLRSAAITAQNARTLFRESFQRWEKAADITFTYVDDEAAADILIGAQGEPQGIAFANVWYKAQPDNPVATLTRATICFNPQIPWEPLPDGDNDSYAIGHVATHEVGHAIGLDHPGRTGALMGYRYDESDGALRPGDVAGAAMLYGRKPDL